MTRSTTPTWAGGALILCLSAVAGRACALPLVASARDSAGAQNVASPQPSTQPPGAQNSQDVTTLELGKPIERDIAGSQKHSYQIALAQGGYANVIVEQRGVDVVVKAFGVDGELIAEFDSENRPYGLENAELAATTAGMYKFDVEVRYKMLHGGRYEIRLADTRAATEKDRVLEEARELHTRAYYAIIAGGEKNREEAQGMLERALGIRERTIGPDHPDIAFTLTLLANIAYYRQEFAKAEPLYQRAIAMLEKTLPPEHPQVAMRLNNLGIVYLNRNDFAKSEQLHRRALEIREHSLAPDHPDIAQSLINLADVYINKGDLPSAEPLLLRAVAIFETVFGPDNLNVSYPLVNLGGIYLSQKDYDKAVQVLERAYGIWERKFGKDHHLVADVLHDLGDVYRGKGDVAKAEELYKLALDIQERKLAAGHRKIALSLVSLGDLYFSQNKYHEAESLYQRALTIQESALSREHPNTLDTVNRLAKLYMAAGDFARAVDFQQRAIAGIEHNIDLNLAIGSERQKQVYLESLPEQLNRAISLDVGFAGGNQSARELAITTILRRKGRMLDAMSDSFAALRTRLDIQHQALLDRLNDVTTRLAKLVLNGPQQVTVAEHQNQIKLVEAERERIEIEISDLTAGFYQQPQVVTLAVVRSKIASDAALIELAVYRPFDPKAEEDNAYGEPRYVAYVVRNQGDVEWKDLGTAKEIDGRIEAFRQILRDPQRKDVQQASRAVSDKVIQPIRALLGNATHLLISPDGQFNLIPFEALEDDQGHYLIERYSITYLTSGRDLLRMQAVRASKSAPWVIADPFFGEPESKQLAALAPSNQARGPARDRRRSITNAKDLSQVYFAPLTGTAQEARAIHTLFPETKVLTGLQATVSQLKQTEAPRILHIATHGFFLDDTGPSNLGGAKQGARQVNNTWDVHAGVEVENPLLRSGLALAGANLGGSARNSGLLTALEASSLNLWGTKLVTLSACDTGLGDVRNGEGVYGLRRAFFLAGTETLVMSLWPVSDRVTREMMTAYYTGLKQGLGRGEALRQAELAMMKRKDRQHPFYWASFIHSGEWAGLDGRR
jgi:CHAT domain-containing protein/predicted negative regulator of RcsB-dependent stress response